MKISNKIHLDRSWMVDNIAKDFKLWDVWEIPINADNSQSENFTTFYKVVSKSFMVMHDKTTIASILFNLRSWIAKIIPLDKNINSLPIPGCSETTFKTRLNTSTSDNNIKTGCVIKIDESGLEFLPVFLLENESLHELSNDTAHILIHFGWIKKNNGCYTATLAIYVKPRKVTGVFYLKLIEPFRHYIVYPTLMRNIRDQWSKQLSKEITI